MSTIDSGEAARRPDGGDSRPLLGDVVVDLEEIPGERDEAIVVSLPPIAASDWVAYQDRESGEDVTVAEDNPEYDENANVVVVGFRDDVEEYVPGYAGEKQLSSARADFMTYAFPPERLEVVGSVREADEDDLDEDQVALMERLEESADVDVIEDSGEAVLAVEKLGAEHIIRPDGSVEDGPMSDRLRDIAEEYLGGEGE